MGSFDERIQAMKRQEWRQHLPVCTVICLRQISAGADVRSYADEWLELVGCRQQQKAASRDIPDIPLRRPECALFPEPDS